MHTEIIFLSPPSPLNRTEPGRKNWTWQKVGKRTRYISKWRNEIEPAFSEIPVARQCELLGLSRSTFFYSPAPEDPEGEFLQKLLVSIGF